ncbi:MAG: precorrin-6y C5,15-methyltransferase (decarboxylating) subunit CbiE [Isosphaeraceae bacterium]
MSDDRSKLVILGIGDDGMAGLTDTARRILGEADVILGGNSALGLLHGLGGRKVVLEPEMAAALRQVREALGARRPVLVSGGDPLFYGVARYLCDRLGKDRFEVIPHVSSMQLAFARVKESWDDAYLANLAGRPIESLVDRIRTAEKVGLFSSDELPPSRVARALLDRGIDYFRAFVCENLGLPDERVTQAELADLVEMEFNPLNVMILIRKPNRPDRASRASGRRLFGNPDDAFAQALPRRGLITQAEVRSIALAQLDIRPTSTVWDIGAGSGSVAIEAAQLASLGVVYAIEPEPADIALIQANAESLRGAQRPSDPRSRPGGPGRAAGPGRRVRGRDGASGGAGPRHGLPPPGARRQPGDERRHDRGADLGPPGPAIAGGPGAGLERQPRAGHRADGTAPLRRRPSDVPAGGHQGRPGR